MFFDLFFDMFFDMWSVRLVRLAGFEPTTPWFVAKYSIQLSYSRSRTFGANPECNRSLIGTLSLVRVV
jgi:hypothetical protein